jgi:alpha-tubulin suppressor-like RCC1 family protein
MHALNGATEWNPERLQSVRASFSSRSCYVAGVFWRASLLALGWWACCGCSETTPTQVIVQLYVEDALAPGAKELHVSIENDDSVPVFEKDLELDGAPGRVARIPLVPKGGDPTRRYVIRAKLSDGTNVIGRIEARSGYVDGELRTLNLWFQSACAAKTDCGEGRTCDRGTCRGACFDTSPVDTTTPSRPSCKECQKCLVGCEATPDAACGCSGDQCVGSDCVPENKARFVAAGWEHSCAVLTNNVVHCWGTLPELGMSASAPIATSALGSSGVSVGVHGCSISEQTASSSSSRTCWGPNELGQLGDGTQSAGGVVTLGTGASTFRRVDVGKHHTCALSQNSEVSCWGSNATGQIGNGTLTLAPSPVVVGTGYARVVAGGDQSCALEEGGTLRCWGQNYSGQVGVDDRTAIPTPVEPGCDDPNSPTCFHDWIEVGAGYWVTCAIREGGELYCWGSNEQGGLGIGSPFAGVEISTPTRVGQGIAWAQVEGGFRHTCGIDEEGRLYCWGYNGDHEVEAGGSDIVGTPTRVETDTSEGFRAVAPGQFHTCALRDDQTVWCWGKNANGQVGGGDEVAEQPTRVCF